MRRCTKTLQLHATKTQNNFLPESTELIHPPDDVRYAFGTYQPT
jgi:hypothetical protein